MKRKKIQLIPFWNILLKTEKITKAVTLHWLRPIYATHLLENGIAFSHTLAVILKTTTSRVIAVDVADRNLM